MYQKEKQTNPFRTSKLKFTRKYLTPLGSLRCNIDDINLQEPTCLTCINTPRSFDELARSCHTSSWPGCSGWEIPLPRCGARGRHGCRDVIWCACAAISLYARVEFAGVNALVARPLSIHTPHGAAEILCTVWRICYCVDDRACFTWWRWRTSARCAYKETDR